MKTQRNIHEVVIKQKQQTDKKNNWPATIAAPTDG